MQIHHDKPELALWHNPCHRHTLLEEDVAVRQVSDHHRHPSTAVFEAGIGMKDVESRGKQFGFPRSAFCSQWCDHHIRCISEEGLNLSLYDLSLERPKVDTLLHRNQLINAPLQISPTGTFNQSLCPLRNGDGHTLPAGKQSHHPCSGPQLSEAVYLALSDNVDYSVDSAGPHNQRDPPYKLRLIGHHQEHHIFIISCNIPHLHVQHDEPERASMFPT